MGWIVFTIILFVLMFFFGIFLMDKSNKKAHAEAVAKVDSILEKEIDNLSNDYQFVNKSLREQCKAEIRKEVIDSRSRSGLEFRPSYLNRGPIKIPQLAKIVKRFVDLDKPTIQDEVNKAQESFLVSTNQSKSSSLDKNKEIHEDKNQTLSIDAIDKKLSTSRQIKNIEKPKQASKVKPKTPAKIKKKPWAQNIVEQLSEQPKENWINKYVILDFETANSTQSSICQIGLVVMENNQIVFHYNSLVRPGPKYFDPANISVHGITLKDVHKAPTFPQIWEEIKKYFNEEYIVMAHNTAFDISVLKAALIYHHLPIPNFSYACTLKMFRKLEPNMENYRLETFANKVNIDFNHHNALEDTLTLILILQKHSQSIESFYWSSITKAYSPKKLIAN